MCIRDRLINKAAEQLFKLLPAEGLAHGRDAKQSLLIRLVAGVLDRFGDCILIGVLPVGAALDHFESCELRPGQGFLQGVVLDVPGAGDQLVRFGKNSGDLDVYKRQMCIRMKQARL